MSNNNLTIEEKRKIARRNYRVKGVTKAILSAVAVVMVVVLAYYGFIGFFFFVMPRTDRSSDKISGRGYSKPLHAVNLTDNNEYTLAYYFDDCWHVVDDTSAIKHNVDNFIVYKRDDIFRKDSDRRLYLFCGKGRVVHTSLSSFTLIYDRCFKDCEKRMTMDEFEAYCNEKEFFGVYIFE